MKKILILLLIILSILFIYITNQDNKIYYVNIDVTNSKYNNYIYKYYKKNNKLEKNINSFSNKDLRTTDLIRNIEENQKIKKQTIQNALIKADILTLNIGKNDINYKIGNTSKEELYKYTDEVLNDIEKLFITIRKYCKEKIYYIGIYNDYGISYNDYIKYTNKRLEEISKDYNIYFINPNNIKSDNLSKGISQIIIKKS